jgi:hypothetical protein
MNLTKEAPSTYHARNSGSVHNVGITHFSFNQSATTTAIVTHNTDGTRTNRRMIIRYHDGASNIRIYDTTGLVKHPTT